MATDAERLRILVDVATEMIQAHRSGDAAAEEVAVDRLRMWQDVKNGMPDTIEEIQ